MEATESGETVDLCWMQSLNGHSEVLTPGIPTRRALGALVEAQRQANAGELGTGVVVFLRPSTDPLAAVAQAMRDVQPIVSGYEAFYKLFEATEQVWPLVRDQSPSLPQAALYQALIRVAAQAVRTIVDLKLQGVTHG